MLRRKAASRTALEQGCTELPLQFGKRSSQFRLGDAEAACCGAQTFLFRNRYDLSEVLQLHQTAHGEGNYRLINPPHSRGRPRQPSPAIDSRYNGERLSPAEDREPGSRGQGELRLTIPARKISKRLPRAGPTVPFAGRDRSYAPNSEAERLAATAWEARPRSPPLRPDGLPQRFHRTMSKIINHRYLNSMARRFESLSLRHYSSHYNGRRAEAGAIDSPRLAPAPGLNAHVRNVSAPWLDAYSLRPAVGR